MALETATYISQLVATNPPGSDLLAQADDHIRLTKTVLQNQFPNLGAAAVTVTASQLNSVAASGGLFSVGTSTTSLTIGTGTQTFTTQASLGFAVGQNIKITSNADVTAYMQGTCTAYNSTTGAMSVSVSTTGGAGTVASWSITVLVAPQGVASATVDLLSGTAIASAATINLDTATGNRVHVTGTTTITAVTLTRGPRTVIFDGALTLTHHATNNNLPGAANITTVAGDRAIYESDGTTVYCIGYFRKDGTPLAGSGSPLTVVSASAAAAALLNTNITAAFDVYDIVVEGVTSVNNAEVRLRFEIAGSVISTSTYQYNELINASAVAAVTSGAPGAYVALLNCGNGASNSFNVTIRIYRPATAGLTRQITWAGTSNRTEVSFASGNAMNQGTGALTGIQLYPDSGTITCTMRLYGVPNA